MTIENILVIRATNRNYNIEVKSEYSTRKIASFDRTQMAGTSAYAMAACVNSLKTWLNPSKIMFIGSKDAFKNLDDLDLIYEEDRI